MLDGDFIVRYDVNRSVSGGSIQVGGLQTRAMKPQSLSSLHTSKHEGSGKAKMVAPPLYSALGVDSDRKQAAQSPGS